MIDLHVHSSISDGSQTPDDIISKAEKLGIHTLALTDHNSVDGLQIASHRASKSQVNFLNGMEISVHNGKNRQFHILGINLDIDNKQFSSIYKAFRNRREEYLEHVFDQLNKKGIPITIDDTYTFSTVGKLDRQAICKWLVSNGYAKDISRGWIDYVDHIPHRLGELASIEEAMAMIHEAGGKAFLAHFTKPIGLYGYNQHERHDLLGLLKSHGLDGIERYYPSFTNLDTEEADYFMKKFNLIPSGGTDYHGLNRKNIELGIGQGNFHVPDSLLDNIL